VCGLGLWPRLNASPVCEDGVAYNNNNNKHIYKVVTSEALAAVDSVC